MDKGARHDQTGEGLRSPVTSAAAASHTDMAVLNAAWVAVAQGLRRDLGVRSFDHWLKALTVGDFCADTGTLGFVAPTGFSATFIAERFADRLLLAMQQHVPAVRQIRVRGPAARGHATMAATPMAAPPALPHAAPADRMAPVATSAAARAAAPAAAMSGFDARLNFDRFVVGRSNILAANAARRMATLEPPLFNPLYLRSGTGQGKTHLLNAMGQAYAAANPHAHIIMMSAEKFMLEFVGAMRGGDMMAFKARLRSADLLLLDDLQFVIGKGSTQEELLHTIDDLLTSGKRLVVAADRPPHALDGIDARLRSRLEGGLVADIEAPDAALREMILRQRLDALPGVDVPADVIAYLVASFTRNIRELEGALNKLLAYAALTGAAIDMTLAAQRLAESVRPDQPRITIDAIQRAVCSHYKLDRSDMGSKRRVRAIARPRQVAMYLAKELTPRSYPEIGRKFGGRDHSTVIHAVRAIEALRLSDSEIDADVMAIRRVLLS